MVFSGKAFIDATYEVDLMAAAGVKDTVGTESADQYGEQFKEFKTEVFHNAQHLQHTIQTSKIPLIQFSCFPPYDNRTCP